MSTASLPATSDTVRELASTPERQTPRPRVAYIMSRFPKLTETFVLDEILELERRGIQVEVFPLWRERADVMHPEAQAVVDRAHFTPTLDGRILRDNLATLFRRPGRYLGTLATLIFANRRSARFLTAALAIFPKACSFARRMQDLEVRHCHAHFASHPAAAAFVVGRLSGIPWSFTAHGSDLHREQAMLAEKVEEARFVVAISEFNRRFILDRVGNRNAAKVCVIHCGVEPERFTAQARRQVREVAARFEIGCIGTLHAVKGQAQLLEACAKLASDAVDWRCHLVGDGPDRRALEERSVRLGVADRVVFHGACPREEVRSLLSGFDVAVAPSVPTADGRREGIPVVLMEAAATGLPLVASRLSGIPEIVEDEVSGLLVEPGDVAGLHAALLRVAHDPRLAARLARAARARVEDAFSLRRTVADLAERMLSGERAS